MGATIFAGGDPSKVDVSGYTKGDILAADATGTLTILAIGSQSEVLTVDTPDPQSIDWQPGGGGGGGTPSNTVVTETAFGQASTAGLLTDYSRGDHTHGTPASPSVPTPATTVASETSFGIAPAVGTGVLYARNDHTHGSPTAPTAASVGADPAGSAAAAQAASQPLDSDLTTIAGLTATNNNTMQGVAGSWASRTPAQARAALGVGTQIVMRQAYVTSGSITIPNSGGIWAAMAGFVELLIPAAVGDYVDVTVNNMRTSGSNRIMDIGVVTGGGAAIQRYMGTGSGTPTLEGNPGWYFDVAGFVSSRGPQGFTVAAGDLDTGNVRFAIVLKTSSATGTFYADADYPFYWRAMNFGPVI